MIKVASSLVMLFALLIGSAGPLVAAPARARHSGTVVLIDVEHGVLVVDEVGPWRVEQGRTVTTRLWIELTPDTPINTYIRVNAPDRFAGDFIEVALDAADLTPGDVVTVDCRHEGNRLIAAAVTLVALD